MQDSGSSYWALAKSQTAIDFLSYFCLTSGAIELHFRFSIKEGGRHLKHKEFMAALDAFNEAIRAVDRLNAHLVVADYASDGAMRREIAVIKEATQRCCDCFETQNNHHKVKL